MQIHTQAKNLELTPAIEDYISKRITNLEKLLSKMEGKGGEAKVSFEVARVTNRHKGGEVFHADCRINVDGQNFYSQSDEADVFAAIDAVKESLFNEISKTKDRKQTLYRRGASSVKKMMKGLSNRNPFTSKY